MENKRILTVDIGASKIRIQLVGSGGDFETEKTVDVGHLELDNQKFTELLAGSIETVLSITPNPEEIQAISIGVPGQIESDRKIEKMTNIKKVENLDIVGELKKVSNLPVFLLNDADAACLGEKWIGAGKGYSNIVMLTLGSGIGSGVIINNEIKSGTELGHIQMISGDKRPCRCGKINCAESFLGLDGLAKIYIEIFGKNDKDVHCISPEMRGGIRNKDEKWLLVQNEYSRYLAEFITKILSIYKPEIIILGGGIAFGNEPLLADIKNKLPEINFAIAVFENSTNLGMAKYAFDQIADN